jgi:hypothetical protein
MLASSHAPIWLLTAWSGWPRIGCSSELPEPIRAAAARACMAVGVQKSGGPTTGVERHDVWAMLEYLMLLLSLIRATVRDRDTLVAENLLLRHQPVVLTRPTRKRPRLRTRDKLFWVVARTLCRNWRRHLVVV